MKADEPKTIRSRLLRRVWRLLHGLEEMLQALLGDVHTFHNFQQTAGDRGGLTFDVTVRRYHPAYWVGWLRCRVLGDRFGSGMYR